MTSTIIFEKKSLERDLFTTQREGSRQAVLDTPKQKNIDCAHLRSVLLSLVLTTASFMSFYDILIVIFKSDKTLCFEDFAACYGGSDDLVRVEVETTKQVT